MLTKYFHDVTSAIIAISTRFNLKLSGSQENLYELSLKQEKINSGIITTTITAAVYILFFIVDIWSLPSQLYTAGLIRFSFFSLSAYVLYLIVNKDDFFIRHYQLIVGGYFLAAGLGVVFLLAIGAKRKLKSL